MLLLLHASSHPPSQVSNSIYLQLRSLRVVEANPVSKLVRFVPRRAIFVDPEGHEANPQIIPISGGKELISGRLSLVADQADLADIEGSVRRAYGDNSRVEQLEPSSFGLWIYRDGELTWARGLAEGRASSVPVQFTMDKPAGDVRLTVINIVRWTTITSPVEVKVTFDWASVRSLLTKRLRASETIPGNEVSLAVDEAIKRGFIRLVVGGTESFATLAALENVKALAQSRIQDSMLTEMPEHGEDKGSSATRMGNADPNETNGWYVGFKLREETSAVLGTETLDLRANAYKITRTAIVEGELVVRR
jgi:hypothetical protein